MWGNFSCWNAKQSMVSGSESLSAWCVTPLGHAHTLLMPSCSCCLTRDEKRCLCSWALCSRCTLSPSGPPVCGRAWERQVWHGNGPKGFFLYAPNTLSPLVQSPSTVVWVVPSSWRRAPWGLAGSVLLPLALEQIVGSGHPRDGSKIARASYGLDKLSQILAIDWVILTEDVYLCMDRYLGVCICVGRVEGEGRRNVIVSNCKKNSMINTKVCMLLYCNDCHFKTSFLPSSYRGKDLRENYCRNPRGEEGGPWCFTTSPETRHEVCDIPLCSQGNPARLARKGAFSLLTAGTQNRYNETGVSVTLAHGLQRKNRRLLSKSNSWSKKSSY